MIVNLSFYLYIETSFADSNLTRKWTSETCCLLYLNMDFTAKARPPVCAQRQQVKVHRGLAELVLGSPLNRRVPHTTQTFLFMGNTGPFSVSRRTPFEILQLLPVRTSLLLRHPKTCHPSSSPEGERSVIDCCELLWEFPLLSSDPLESPLNNDIVNYL